MWVAVVLAVAAFALLGWVLVSHMEERGGKKSGGTALPLLTSDPTASAASTQTPLAPASVVVPAPTAPRDPLPPLEPTTAPSGSAAARTRSRGR